MSEMDLCSDCQGFLPAAGTVCPHCGVKTARTRMARVLTGAAMAVAALATATTLMACYGCPPTGCGGPDSSDDTGSTE